MYTGETFHVATKLTVGLTNQLAAFAKHGEDSGHLSKELLIYSGHLGEAVDREADEGADTAPSLFIRLDSCLYFSCIFGFAIACLRNDGSIIRGNLHAKDKK